MKKSVRKKIRIIKGHEMYLNCKMTHMTEIEIIHLFPVAEQNWYYVVFSPYI